MKRILVSMAVLALTFSVKAQMTEGSVVTTSNGTIHFLYYTPPNYRPSGAGHPLIISLGGVGERGDGSSAALQNLYVGGIPKKIHDGVNMVFTYKNTTDGFIVLAPQLPTTSDWQNYYVDEMIAYGISHFNVDPSRIFLTGYSLGGTGTWNYATSSPNVNKLAGIVPISAGYASNGNYCNIAGNKVAVWAFQGGSDEVYGGNTANDITNQIDQCSNLIIPAFDSTFANEVHGADFWDNKVYSPTNNIQYPNVFQWMLRVNRNIDVSADQNPVPIVAGGTNITLLTPQKFKYFPLLDGSQSTDDDIIVNYLWSQTGGPTVKFGSDPNVSTTTSQWPTTTISDPSFSSFVNVGTYTFVLRVKDYLTSKPGHTQFSTVTVNVQLPLSGHSAPGVDAGDDHVLGSSETFYRIIGTSKFYGSSASAFNWRLLSAPAAAPTSGPLAPTVNNYNGGSYGGNDPNVRFINMDTPGDYLFEFSATNNFNEVGRDTVVMTRLGALPVNYAYFNGQNNGAKNELSWATTAEINSERFDVLRSTDGVNFSVAGSVKSTGGAVLTQYTFEDNAAPGTSYYRLSQVDKDGRASLSKTIAVTNRTTGLFIERYPNPVHDNLTVTVQGNTNGAMQVVIADMQGKAILQQHWQKDLSVLKKVINVGALQNGVYQMIVTVGQEKQVSSFVKY